MSENKLKRDLSVLNVWALALGCIIGSGAFILPGTVFLVKGGPAGTAIALVAAMLMMIIIACNYDFMIKLYPEAGGEFIYAQKAFGRKNAFICSWFLAFSYLVIVPQNAVALAFICRTLSGSIFQSGFSYKIAGYEIYVGEIILSLFALVIFAVLTIRGVKITGIIQTLLVFALISGVAAVMIAAIIRPESSIKNLKPAFNPEFKGYGGMLGILAAAPWAFVGFDTIPQSAEEFNFFHGRTKYIMSFSIILGAFIYIALNTITASVIPEGYADWAAYIKDVPNLDGIKSIPTFYVFYELLGEWGILFLELAVLGAVLSCITGFYMAASRLLYSMAVKNFLPSWFGHLHEKYKTPDNAILFIMAVSMTAPFLGRSVWGWIVEMSSTGAAIGYAYTSAAALKTALSNRNKNVIFMGLLGVIISALFLILLLVPISALNSSLSFEAYICLGIWSLLGIIFYLYE